MPNSSIKSVSFATEQQNRYYPDTVRVVGEHDFTQTWYTRRDERNFRADWSALVQAALEQRRQQQQQQQQPEQYCSQDHPPEPEYWEESRHEEEEHKELASPAYPYRLEQDQYYCEQYPERFDESKKEGERSPSFYHQLQALAQHCYHKYFWTTDQSSRGYNQQQEHHHHHQQQQHHQRQKHQNQQQSKRRRGKRQKSSVDVISIPAQIRPFVV